MGLTNNKVDIIGDDGQYKNTYNILKDISKVWHEMDSMSQSSLMKSLFGVRQANVGVSLIEQFSTAERVLEASLNSSGSAMEEHSRWLESANAKVQQFKASFESLSQTVFDSDFLKGAIDAGTSLLNVFEKLVDTLGVLPVVLGAIGEGFAIKKIGNIYKTLPMLEKTIDSIKNISVGYVGSDGLFDTATVNAYTASLQGLSATQAEVVLSSAGLDKAQRKQVISALQAITATKTLNSEEAISAMTRKLGTAEASKELLVKSQLVTVEQLEAGAEFEVSTEKLKSAVASGVLTQGEANNIAVALGLASANTGLASSFKLLTASILANVKAMATWLFTTPAGWATLAIGAVVGVIAAYAEWGDTLENAREDLSELKDECKTIETDLTSMNDELQTTVDRINELEKKDTLTFTEKEEYDNLVKTNNELQRKIDLLKLEQIEKGREKNQAFIKSMQKDVNESGEYHYDAYDGTIKFGVSRVRDGERTASEMEYISQQLKDYHSNLDKIAKLDEQYKNDLSNKQYQKDKKRIENNNKKISKYLRDKNDEFVTVVDGMEYISNPTTDDEKAVNEWIDYINDFQDRMAIAMGGDNAKTNAFNRVIDNWKFDNIVQELQDLGEQGKVTANMLDNSKYNEFINKLVEIGIINDTTDFNNIALAFNNLEESISGVSESLDMQESIDSFKDKFSGVFEDSLEPALSEVDKIKSAMQTLASGELLEWDDASALMFDIDTERILGDFEEIDGKYRLINNDITSLIKLKDSKILKQKEVVQGLKDEQQETLRALKASLELEKSKLSRSNSKSDAEYYKKQIQDIQTEINKVNSNIRDCDTTLKHLNSQLGNTVDLVSALEERMKKAQEHADKYADAMTKQVDNIIDKYQDELDILEEQKSSLEEQLDVLEEQKSEIEDIIDRHKDLVDVIGDEIDKEIELLEKQREAEEDAIQAKIDALKESKEKQEEENNLIEKELELQKKLADLEKAKQTKVHTYSEARGWHYGVDKEAVANAQTAVVDAQKTYDDAIAEKIFDDQIEALEKQKEAVSESYEEQLKAYEDYYEQWKAVLDEEIKAENEKLAVEIMGSEWREKIKKRDSNILSSFAGSFRSYNGQLKNLVNTEIASLKQSIVAKEDEIKTKQKQIKVWQDYKDQIEKSIDDIKNKYDDYIEYLDGVTLNENSTYEDRQNALNNFIENYRASIDEIKSIQNELEDISASITLDTDISGASNKLADFLEMYRDGMLSMADIMRFDPENAQNAMLMYAHIQTGSDINEIIERLRGYSTGGVNDNTGIVKLHGEKQRVETVFNAQQGRYLYDMVKTGNFSQLVAQKAIDGLKTALKPNQISNSTNDSRVINIQNMTIKSDTPTQFHDQFMKEIGQYWRVELAESRIK